MSIAVMLPPLSAVDQARADLYALLARLLRAPADARLLRDLAAAPPLGGTETPLGAAWAALQGCARHQDAAQAREAFEALFVSAGMPAVNPYASLYLAGFLMDTPLATLRAELELLGLQARPGAGEPEDHLAALLQALRLLITGAPPALPRRDLATQRRFFEAHLAPWAHRCLDDIADRAGADSLLAAVAGLGHAFLALEAQAFELDDEETPPHPSALAA